MPDRKVLAVAQINGVDEEDFGSNEFGSASFTQEMIFDDSDFGGHFNLLFMVCKWGGECRVELAMNIRRLDDPPNTPNHDGVAIDGFAQMFEGTSEDTDDLDGDVDFDFVVPRGKTIINTQRVANIDEGGDFADIRMTVSNNAFEEQAPTEQMCRRPGAVTRRSLSQSLPENGEGNLFGALAFNQNPWRGGPEILGWIGDGQSDPRRRGEGGRVKDGAEAGDKGRPGGNTWVGPALVGQGIAVAKALAHEVGNRHFLGGVEPIASRLITASAHIDGTDDETFGSNEFGSASFTRETVLNDSQPQNLMEMVCKWGGECRVELELTGQRLNDDGVRIDGHAKMFEGTSEETDDFDGQTLFTFVVPKGRTVGNSQTVRNEDEGGDFADISLTVSNVILEDVEE